MNEPTSIALLGDPTLPTSTRHHFDGRGGDHAEGHNLYGLLMNRAGYEGLRGCRARAAALHRVALGLGGDAALGVELDRRRRLDVGVDAPADGHRRRAWACRACRTRGPTSAASAASPTTSSTCAGCR